MKAEHPGGKGPDAGKVAGERWKARTDEEKKEYNDRAEADKERYQRERAEAKANGDDDDGDGDEGAGKKAKKKRKSSKAAGGPKRPKSAYLLFSMEFREKNKESDDKLDNKEIMAAAGAKWKEMSTVDKAPYVDKAAELKAKYAEELKAWQAKQADGGDDAGSPAKKSKKDKKPKAKAEAAPMDEDDDDDDEEEEADEDEDEDEDDDDGDDEEEEE